jgi:HSP20 family molecular chaperone IbpA
MEKETPQSTSTVAPEVPPSPSTPGEHPAPPAGTAKAEPRRVTKTVLRRSTLAIGGIGILALGMLVGISVTQYLGGIPTATAATNDAKAIKLPKAAPAAGAAASEAWNPFREIRDMQLRMDKMFGQMTSAFRLEPRLSLFSDNPGYSLSLRVQDMKDHYEVRAYLPDAKASDVNVRLLDKQTLKVEVTNKTTVAASQKGANEHVTEWGQYAQIIQLPAPVKSEQMKINQPAHELIVTLPKA